MRPLLMAYSIIHMIALETNRDVYMDIILSNSIVVMIQSFDRYAKTNNIGELL